MTRHSVEISHRAEFSAAHHLRSPELSDEENRRLYGPCYGVHGHNYEVVVAVRGPVSARTGMVMNLTSLMELMQTRLLDQVDHKHLNHDVPFLRDVIPTAENIAVAFWRELEPEIDRIEGCRLHRIRIYESRRNSAEYRGPEPRE